MAEPTPPPPDRVAEPPAVLRADGLRKRFPGVLALDDASLSLRAGEVHALMGENGAGKSTLIKVVNGVLAPDAGRVELGGEPFAPASVRDAGRAGVSTVFQEVNLLPMRSVAENLFVGRFPKRFGLIRWGEVRRRARDMVAGFGLPVDVSRPVGSYPIAVQQMVAVVRAVSAGEQDGGSPTRVLVLDEPTSSLDAGEIERLFAVMRRLRDGGMAILFVTHFLDQVYAVADRITVMRGGRTVGEWATGELPKLDLVRAMTGRDLGDALHATGESAADAEGDAAAGAEVGGSVRLDGLGRARSVGPVDFTIGRGEVVGLAGLLGSGRTETARLCFGADAPDRGRLVIDGVARRFRSPRQAIGAGLAMTTEDRKASGIAPNLSVRENLVLALQSRRGVLRRVGRREQRELAERYIRLLSIKTPSPEVPIRSLSGGNQQKVLLARWLATRPRLLILDEPTRGIDVGAKADVARLVRSLAAEGMGALFISSELEEVTAICRHVVVLRDRRQVGELRGDDVTEGRILRLIAGGAAIRAADERAGEGGGAGEGAGT